MAYFLSQTLTNKECYFALARRPKRKGAFSQYRGVVKSTSKLPYRVQLTHQGRRFYIGVYETEIEAAKAYNKAALAIIGPHALLNDVDP